MLCRCLSLSSEETTKKMSVAQGRNHYNSQIKGDYFKVDNKKGEIRIVRAQNRIRERNVCQKLPTMSIIIQDNGEGNIYLIWKTWGPASPMEISSSLG